MEGIIPKEDKPPLTKDNWEPNVGLEEGVEQQEEQQFLKKFKNCFAFILKDLGALKGQEVWIDLMDDAPIFCKPYKYSEAKRKLIKTRTKELFDAQLVEFSNGEYASTTVMLSKKDIFGNWIEKLMGGIYQPINKRTKSN